MLEVILSDITVMGQGYCVIGLERLSPDSYRSVRPMPPQAFAWREPFPYSRGDCVCFDPVPTVVSPPHLEDQQSRGLIKTARSLNETQLIECLRKAEVSPDLEHLFGCQVQRSTQGGKAVWVKPNEARRSICGCEYDNVHFRLYPEPAGFSLRTEVLLRSNERLNSVPVVDREWRRFAGPPRTAHTETRAASFGAEVPQLVGAHEAACHTPEVRADRPSSTQGRSTLLADAGFTLSPAGGLLVGLALGIPGFQTHTMEAAVDDLPAKPE